MGTRVPYMMLKGTWFPVSRGGLVLILIIDRFEGEMAVIEYDGRTFSIPRNLLPAGAREGDVLGFSITIDKKATEERQGKIEELMKEIFD